MKILLKLLFSSLAVFVTAYIVPGVNIDSFVTALVVAIVLGILNTFVKPLVMLLTLPINVLTLGLFSFVINVGLIMLAAYLVAGFAVGSVISALLFGLVMSLVNSFFNLITK